MSGSAGHRWQVRVYYEDTDAAGIVYHANYLRFAERARTEWLRSLGLDHTTLLRERGVRFAVRRCCVDYLCPARLDDLLTVETRTAAAEGARLRLRQDIRREDELLVGLDIVLVALDGSLRPTRIDRALPAAALAGLRGVVGAGELASDREPKWTN